LNQETVTQIKSENGKAFGYTYEDSFSYFRLDSNKVSNLIYSRVDVTKREMVLETAKKVQQDVGDVTILVNNAGML
jgi:NADP-dependent 3-hydroxy acid dehydrogenase YdfG